MARRKAQAIPDDLLDQLLAGGDDRPPVSGPCREGDDAHPANLPFLRRRHPRPRLLLVPRPDPALGPLDEKLHQAGKRVEWADLLRDLHRLQEVTISKRGQQIVLRTPATNSIGPIFKAAGVALPANVRDASAS